MNRETRPAGLAPVTLLAVVLSLSGCAPRRQTAQKNLAESFALAEAVLGYGESPIRKMEVQRKGVRKAAVVLIAPAAVKASLAGYRGAWNLHLMVAPVFNVGDGIEMQMWLREGDGSHLVCSRHLDPARRFEDRAWIPIAIPLNLPGGHPDLEIRISGGPQGDLTGDWLAFADMQLSSEADQR